MQHLLKGLDRALFDAEIAISYRFKKGMSTFW